MALKVNLETKHPGAYVLELKGELDAQGAPEFEKHVEALLTLNPNRVLVNMSEMSYISSAGIGALFGLMKQIKEQGGVISLFKLQHQVRSILDAVKVAPLEDIFYTEEEADAFLKTLQDMGKQLPPKSFDQELSESDSEPT